MKTSLPVLLYILSFFLTSGASQKSSNLSCLYDSFETLICTWIPVKNTTKAQCQLTASVDYGKPPKTCQMHGISIRNCTLILRGFSLTAIDTILLVVSCRTVEKWTEIQNQKLEPFQNIQLQPPCKFQLENASKPSYNFTWKLCVLSHYLKERLRYEVRYRANSPAAVDTILPIAQDQNWLVIENLSPGTVFEAAIRVKVQQNNYYKSIWSNWSTSITWKTDPKASPQHTLFLALAGSFIIFIFIAIFFKAISTTSKCFRKVQNMGLPNPAEFFPSLVTVHGRDVKKWLSSPTSITSFQITTETPVVSVLEIIQKSSKESCHLLPKECFTHTEGTTESSGQSLSSCFTNRGYFFFHHLDSLEIDSCKVYFTFDAVTRESRSSEDGNSYSYRPFHEANYNLPLPTNNLMTSQENYVYLQETRNLNQVGDYLGGALSSAGNLPIASITELTESTEEEAYVVLSSKTPEEFSVDSLSEPEQSSNNNDGMELLTNVGSPMNTLEDKEFIFPNEVQTSDFCRTASFSQIPSSSEVYLSLRDLQRHYSHHSV